MTATTQNVSMVNTVLASIVANEFQAFADAIEHKKQSPHQVAASALKQAMNVVFNGNGYDAANQAMLVEQRGLRMINSGVEAMAALSDPKNVDLFLRTGTFTEARELAARQTVMLQHYIETVVMEAECLLHMWRSVETDERSSIQDLRAEIQRLSSAVPSAHGETSADYHSALLAAARQARVLRLEKMQQWREDVERSLDRGNPSRPPFPAYSDLLFVDQTMDHY